MKLTDLTTIPILEIEIGPDQTLGIKDPDLLQKLKSTGTDIEGFELKATQTNDEIVFAIVDGEELLSVIVGTVVDDFPGTERKTIRIGRSYTPEKYRGNGYSPALYDGLTRLGYRIVSDLQLSQAALNVWKKLDTKRKLQYFDWETKQYTKKDPLSSPTISFVLEYIGPSRCPLLEDMKMFAVTQ